MHCADHVIYIIFSSWNTRVFLNRISKNLVFAVPGLYISYYSHYSNWAVLSYIGKLVKAPLIKSHKIQQFDVNCLDSAESEKAKVPVKTMKLYRYCRVAVSKLFFMCVTQKHQMVLTHDLTMETAVASDMYCKWTSINAFSWTLHNIGSY